MSLSPSRALLALALAAALGGCSMSNFGIGPYRIDVQQGNALDAESVAKLKPGLSRTQVRFLMGTPLVVDPFRDNRWDYVYEMRDAGELTEKKRITLIFDGETLTRVEGDGAGAATRGAFAYADATPATPEPATSGASAAEPQASAPADAAPADPAATSIVEPLDPPAPTEAAPSQALPDAVLAADTEVETLQPDPGFADAEAAPEVAPATATDPARAAVDAWVEAWSRRDQDAYLAAYSQQFLPQGGGTRADWEKRRRLLLGLAQNIEVRLEETRAERAADGSVAISFKQHYRSDSYRDAVAKLLRLVEEDGRWLIVEERVLGVLRPARR